MLLLQSYELTLRRVAILVWTMSFYYWRFLLWTYNLWTYSSRSLTLERRFAFTERTYRSYVIKPIFSYFYPYVTLILVNYSLTDCSMTSLYFFSLYSSYIFSSLNLSKFSHSFILINCDSIEISYSWINSIKTNLCFFSFWDLS